MDIIERLRTRKAFWLNGSVWMLGTEPDPDCMEAADEIERLTKECEEQARLNGMGAERELALRAEIERLQSAIRRA